MSCGRKLARASLFRRLKNPLCVIRYRKNTLFSPLIKSHVPKMNKQDERPARAEHGVPRRSLTAEYEEPSVGTRADTARTSARATLSQTTMGIGGYLQQRLAHLAPAEAARQLLLSQSAVAGLVSVLC